MKLTHPFDLATFQKKLLASPLRFLLIPLSWLYGLIVSIRNRLYGIGVFKARRLPCRVISVGNIAVGGTGKTPAVIAIAKHLQQKGVRVAILLRGYKRASRERVTIVSDGERLCASLEESGDEAYMLARHLNGVPIVVGRQRYQAGRVALERFDVDVLLLDDGFQHRQLARDVDILTVPAYSVASEYPIRSRERLLPAGGLREPWTALRRADIILLTHTDAEEVTSYQLPVTRKRTLNFDRERAHIFRHRKSRSRSTLATVHRKLVQQLAPNALILESIHQPVRLYPLSEEVTSYQLPVTSKVNPTSLNWSLIQGKRVLAVCGIANPDAFVATLRQYSPECVALLAFPDHHVYTAADMTEIDAAFQTSRSDLIVTTQKDEQKLVGLVADRELVIAVLEIALVITEGIEKFEEVLLDC